MNSKPENTNTTNPDTKNPDTTNPMAKLIGLKFGVFFLLLAGMAALTQIPSCAPKDNDTVIYLVRHAEKITGKNAGRDPQLTSGGKIRAQVLAELLRGKNINHVHSSDYIRTRDTAAPLATIMGLKIEIYDPRKLGMLADQIRAQGGRHLVVGHSNTTQEAAIALGSDASEPPIVEKNEYDRLYAVRINDGGETHTKLTRYGVRYVPEK